jgi:hypothetical protein
MNLFHRHIDSVGELVSPQGERRKKFRAKDFTGMGPHSGHGSLTADDLNFRRALIGPPKAKTKSIVVQLMIIAAQRLQAAAGWAANIAKLGGRVEHVKLALGGVLECPPSCRTNPVPEELFDTRLCKASDHGASWQ